MVLFKNDKRLLKANLHCHSTVSDGRLSPEALKEMYLQNGYQVVAFTDHDVLQSQQHLTDENFLAIDGCEYGISQKVPPHKCYHLCLYATRPGMAAPPLPSVPYGDMAALNAYLKDRTDEGFLVCYNHPHWSLQTHADYAGLENIFAMEIYNHNCEVADGCNGTHEQVYNEILRHRVTACGEKATPAPLFCVATDDNHNGEKDDSCGGFTYINSPTLHYTDVLEALARGNFYASQGPLIHEVRIEDGVLHVACSPASRIAVYSNLRSGYFCTGKNMTKASINLSGRDRFLRVAIRDEAGRNAWSNAYWL